ncbi:MAG: CheR family methyltransferase, partial [Planctomycetaceae bacterium]
RVAERVARDAGPRAEPTDEQAPVTVEQGWFPQDDATAAIAALMTQSVRESAERGGLKGRPGAAAMSVVPTSPTAAVMEDLLRRWLGLDVATVGSAALARAVRGRMQATGIADPAAYAARALADEAERDALVEDVVVAESWFFRDPQVFDFVARYAVTLAALPGRQPVRILSAPCAAGEEPYSIAMALFDAGLVAGQFTIDAVDVSRVALARAARGRYSANAFRNADLSFRDRWFHAADNAAVIDDRVRGPVAFSWANVLDEAFRAGRGLYDVIFCRNLLIYLDAEARTRVERTLDALLAPDGVLVLGAAEPPVMRGGWIPAGGLSVFALRRAPHAPAEPAPATPRRPTPARDTAAPGRPRVEPARTGPTRPVPAKPADAKASPPQPLDEVLREAGTLANAGRLADALAVCERGRREREPSPELFYLMGMIHQSAGDLDLAEGCLHKTLYLDAAHDEALLALALIAAQRGDERMAATYRQSAARALARKEAP